MTYNQHVHCIQPHINRLICSPTWLCTCNHQRTSKYSGLFLTAPGVQHALDVASSMSILDILRNNLLLAFSTPGLRRFVCMNSLTFRFQKWGAKLKTWSLFQLLPFMLFLPSWITPCWIQTHICNNKRRLPSSDTGTVEASKPDWPKLCKYGPQNKHHGTLANCSSCNHKITKSELSHLSGLQHRAYRKPFWNHLPHLSLRQELTCFGGKRAQGRTISKHMDRRTAAAAPHSMTPMTHKQEPSKSTFRQSRIKTRLAGWELTAKIFANLVRKTKSETCTRSTCPFLQVWNSGQEAAHPHYHHPHFKRGKQACSSIKMRFSTTAISFLAATISQQPWMADGWQASTNTGMQKTTLARLWLFSRMRKPAGKIVKLKLAKKLNQFLLQSKEPTSTLCFFGGVQLWEIQNFHVKLKSSFQCDAMPDTRCGGCHFFDRARPNFMTITPGCFPNSGALWFVSS